jgi:hypothetical protein
MLATGGAMTDCDTALELEDNADGNVPDGVAINANAGVTNICGVQEGRSGTWFQYQHVTGEVASVVAAAAPACP